ncbi:Hint domain-containing protein [Vannielia litorea]|uniref:Hint domain-containing protein n=1 Tax=Vannielia litorea TaxID=1217970 RepID=A0A1N6FC72_9RHOB|nr:Hint domain-containing protein [Vannielia litorea]SIN92868.1 Hint domain-containing protein [Vannielia litorea]
MGTELAQAQRLTRAEVQADIDEFTAHTVTETGVFAKAYVAPGLAQLLPNARRLSRALKPSLKSFSRVPEAGTWLESAISANARVLTPEGAVAAGQLSVGDVVETKDLGPLKVRWVGLTRVTREQLAQSPALCPVRVKAASIDGTYPRQDLEISPNAGLVMRSNSDPQDECIVSATALTRRAGFCKSIPRHGITYVQILLERHAVMVVEGLEMESFHPGNLRPTASEAGLWSEIMAVLPELEHELETYGPRVRPDLRDRAKP